MAGCMKRISAFFIETAKLCFFLLLLLCLPQVSSQTSDSRFPVTNIHDGDELTRTGPKHFCYINTVLPGWKQTWTRVQVKVWSAAPLKVTVAKDEEGLRELEAFSVWALLQGLMREPTNESSVPISLFRTKTCFKVEPSQDGTSYRVAPLRQFDVYLIVVFFSGLLLFVFAESLSRSQVFYYSAGMSTGLIASLLILIFITARLLPKKSPFYLMIVGGWSFSLYVLQLVFKNLQIILKEHLHLALGYVAVVGFVSFAVCYRHGPLVEERSINILSWTLQLLGLLLMYAGIQIRQVALAVILAGFCAKNLEYPLSIMLLMWRKVRPALGFKPPPRRLLTEEEYQQQGEEETRRALEELRRHCESPGFSPWKAVSRLQSPKRFADFVEGSPHLMPNEVSVHAQEYGGTFFDEELFATDEEEEEEDGDIKPLMYE